MPATAAYMRQRRAKQAVLRDQLKVACQDCGKTGPRLHFHHRDKTSKRTNPGWMMAHAESTFLAEVAKCDVLCGHCHAARHHPMPEHGTITRYNHRDCRCAECRAAWSAYIRRRKATAS